MILRDMYIAIKTLFSQLYQEFILKNDKNSAFLKNVITILLIGAVAYGGFYGYKFFVHRKEASAQKVFSECVTEFENAKNGSGLWNDVVLAFDLGYQQNSGSRLAPYFLAYKADALYEQGKPQEALQVLEIANSKMSESDNLFGMYQVKLALMKLDSDQESVQKEGLEVLKAEADKESSSGNNTALYYMGLYQWEQGNTEEAKNYWKKIVEQDKKVRAEDTSNIEVATSQYVKLAQEKLDQFE